MRFLLALIPFILISCIEPNVARMPADSYSGLLHVNSCMGGASYLVYKEDSYRFGSKSIPELNETVTAIGKGESLGTELVMENNCEKVFKIRFSGEFEKESALTGYGNDEVRRVVQIYQFILD